MKELEKSLIKNNKINFERLAEMIHQGDKTEDYIEYDYSLAFLASVDLIYTSEDKRRPSYSLATIINPHLAMIDSKNKCYYFKSSEDARQFSIEVFREDHGEERIILEMI
jgi:hypothetical protein